jgi:hypothetical protein
MPAGMSDMTHFYNELVQSDFSEVNKSPVTFGKEKRFKEIREDSPGPGYYNPKNRKLSNYSISQTFSDIRNYANSFQSP